MNRFVLGLSFSLPVLWLVGVSTIDLARLCVFLTSLSLLLHLRRNNNPWQLNIGSPALLRGLLVFSALTLLLQAVAFIRSIDTLSWGLDSVIFAQVAQRFAGHHDFLSSINRVGFQNFLSDHFSPVLAVPGLLAKLGLGAPLSLAMVHAIALASSMVLLYLLAGSQKVLGAISVVLFLCFPSVRHQIGWGTQVEFLALPFVGGAFLTAFKGRLGLTICAWALASLCKETLSCYAIAFFGTVVVKEAYDRFFGNWLWDRGRLYLSFVAIFLFGGWFFIYVTFHEFLFDLPYDHLNRVNLADLLNVSVIGEKAIFFLAIVLIPIVLLRKSFGLGAVLVFLPFGPFVAMVLLSGFTNMWNLLTHYSVLPIYILLCGVNFYLRKQESAPKQDLLPSSVALSLVLALCFCFSNRRPMKVILRGVPSMELPAELLGEQRVVRVDYGLAAYAMQQGLQHEWLRPDTPLHHYPIEFTWVLDCSDDSSSAVPCRESAAESENLTQPRNPYWLLYRHDPLQ